MKIVILFINITCLFSVISQAQWLPDVRLTNNDSLSNTSPNNAWCITANSPVLHVVWHDRRNGNDEIYYKRSTNDGVSWGTDIRLTNNSGGSYSPSIAVSGLVTHVVWYDYSDGNFEIYHKRSTNGGINWGTDTRMTNNIYNSLYPSMSVSGSVVHVVWQDNRNINWEIYYKRSTDGGISWGTDTRLTNNIYESRFSSVAVSGLVVHVVWQDFRDGSWEIYYKRSTDGGESWPPADTRLTYNPAWSWSPSVAVTGSVVHVVWQDNRAGNWEIYHKRSTNGGVNWGADTRLTNNSAISSYASVAISGPFVHVVWQDERDGNTEIYYKRSTDEGVSWPVTDTRLTSNPDLSQLPSVATSGSFVHTVWYDSRDGNTEIYYKRNPTGNTVGMKSINSEIPNEFSLGQNYPNPFNPSTTIQFAIPKTSLVKLNVYDVLGREAESLVDEHLNPGIYEVEWNGSNYTSGVYYYRITADNYLETRKMILLK
jgi:hypothetical protein